MIETRGERILDHVSTRLRKSDTYLSIALRKIMGPQYPISMLCIEHDAHGECPWLRSDEAFDLPLVDSEAEDDPAMDLEIPLIQVLPPEME